MGREDRPPAGGLPQRPVPRDGGRPWHRLTCPPPRGSLLHKPIAVNLQLGLRRRPSPLGYLSFPEGKSFWMGASQGEHRGDGRRLLALCVAGEQEFFSLLPPQDWRLSLVGSLWGSIVGLYHLWSSTIRVSGSNGRGGSVPETFGVSLKPLGCCFLGGADVDTCIMIKGGGIQSLHNTPYATLPCSTSPLIPSSPPPIAPVSATLMAGCRWHSLVPTAWGEGGEGRGWLPGCGFCPL